MGGERGGRKEKSTSRLENVDYNSDHGYSAFELDSVLSGLESTSAFN